MVTEDEKTSIKLFFATVIYHEWEDEFPKTREEVLKMVNEGIDKQIKIFNSMDDAK